MTEQNRSLAQLERSVLEKRPVRLGGLTFVFLVGLMGGFVIGITLAAAGLKAELEESRQAVAFFAQASAAGIELKLQSTDKGEILTVIGPGVPGVTWHKT